MEPGDRALLFIPMSIDLYVALLACLHLGAVAVFVDAWADRRRLDAAVAAARPRAFLGVPRAHLLRLASAAVRSIPVTIVFGRGPFSLRRCERPADAGLAAQVADDAHALVTFTTGSTGRPKAAARSHAFLWAQHGALDRHLALKESDVDLPTLPVFVLNNLALGVTSVLPDFDARRPAEIDPARVYRQIIAERVTTSSGSPAFYERLARWCSRQGVRLPLRALFTGGAPVLPPLARLLADTVEGSAHVVYGSTEAEPIAGIEARDMLAVMGPAGSEGLCAGQPVPDVRLRLLRPHEGPIELGDGGLAAWEVGPGETGEIVVAGAHVLRGYLDNPEADRENKIPDGETIWHRTGDAGRLDEDGRLWLMGRLKQRVTRAGETRWPLPAEIRALRVDGINHAAYLGEPDADLGQRAVLVVEIEGGRLTESVESDLAAALEGIAVDEVHVMPRIPRDPRHASKTDLDALRALLKR